MTAIVYDSISPKPDYFFITDLLDVTSLIAFRLI